MNNEEKQLGSFDKKKLETIIKDIERLILLIDIIVKDFNKNNTEEISKIKNVYLDLFKKIAINLQSISILLKELEFQPLIKISIFSLFRTCLSDCLIGIYLYPFITDKVSFENELEAIDLDFVKYFEFMTYEEPKILGSSESQIHDFISIKIQNLIETYHFLYDSENNKWKSNKEIRKNSSENYFKTDKEKIKKLDDKAKYERIIKYRKLKEFGYIYLLFRYFSQFHHYTFASRNFLNKNEENDLKLIIITTSLLYDSLRLFGIALDCKEDILKRIKFDIEKY